MSGTLEMLLGNIDFPNEQHSAVSISIFYFKFKVIPRKDVWRCREKILFFGDQNNHFYTYVT